MTRHPPSTEVDRAGAGKKRSPGELSGDLDAMAAPAFEVRRVTSDDEFEAMGPAWDDLLARSAERTVFMSHQWLHAWWTAYRPQAELHIVIVADGERLHGIAPLMVVTERRAGLNARVLRFIGDGSGETDHVSFLVGTDYFEPVLERLLAALDTLPWDIAELNQLPQQSATAVALLAWLERRRYRTAVTPVECPVNHLPANYEQLLLGLPSRLRTSVRSSRKRLEQKHAVDFGLYERQEEMEAALTALFETHASRWEAKGQPGVFEDARRRAFYHRLTQGLLEKGWLRFFVLKIDGRPVAHQYCFAVDDTVMLLQEGFDFAFADQNVGNVLRARVLEYLIASGTRCYDFLAGTSRHKRSWSNGAVYDLRVRFARRSWRGWLFLSAPLLAEKAKDRLRPLRDRLLQRLGRRPAA